MFNNDERYWKIHTLNKWFAISSVLFLISMAWTFIDDNDDEFKIYQREFRRMEIEISEQNLQEELEFVKTDRLSHEKDLADAEAKLNTQQIKLDELENNLAGLQARHYNENMIYQSQKAEVDAIKYLVESENAHQNNGDHHGPSYKDEHVAALDLLQDFRLIKEGTEIEISENDDAIKSMRADVKLRLDELNIVLKQVNIVDNKLKKIDRNRMTLANQVGDVVRDLPILDFLDPYYKINQVVVRDVKYDVNFAAVPKVDRCTSCHLGIDNPDFADAPQPYTTHPNLDLYITSASKHPMDNFGCTSCHAGRGRGTSFVSSTHTPNTPEDKERWKDEYDWEKMHHWLQPMLPTRYTQASCFKCHSNTSDLAGGEKLNLGLSLVDKAGCNGCHHNDNWPSQAKAGPDLRKINEKLDEDWVAKWVKNPSHFRYNTRMPAIFQQDNQKSPETTAYNNAEIAGITEYLFKGKEKDRG